MRRTPGTLPSALTWRLALRCLLILGAGTASCVRAVPNELGHPLFRDFPPGKSNIAHLCQAVIQDAAGFIYIANGTLIRCYDGSTWRVIKPPTESAGVRKFALTADGTIYAAGAGLLGRLQGAGETQTFVSLVDRLPPTAHGAEDLFDVLAVGNTVYFADEEKILVWRDERFTVVPCPTPPHSRGARLHRVGDAVYVTALERALCRLERDQLEVVADDPVLRQNPIISVEAGPSGTLVLLTAQRGFFRLAAGSVTPMPTEADRFLAGKGILRAQRLADGSRAVVFTSISGDGGLLLSAEGRYLGPIDASLGLYVKTIRDLFPDREGGLWLGTETGLIRLEWPSAVTVFDAVNGLGSGTAVDVVRHEGSLYAATGEGVFRLKPSDADGRVARFERLLNQPVFSLASHPGGLLVLGYTEVFLQSPTGFSSVARLPPGGGSLLRSKRDPERVWLRTTRGIQALRHTPEGWRDEGAVRRDDADKRELAEATEGSLARRLSPLVLAASGAVASLHEENSPEGLLLWVGGARGLVRVEQARASPPAVPYATLLSAVNAREGDQLAPGHPALRFDYVALRHQLADSVSYQSRLTGYERDWTDWAPGRTRAFAGLPAGDFRFEVRARDAYGRFATPASLGFEVLPSWWLTGWAFLGYGIAGTAAISGLVRLRTGALRRRAARLEALVAERTAELAQRSEELARQNTELLRLNQLELDETISARLAGEKARLEVLRYQLNPHFLYNTLASISASLPAGLSTARTMLERLADFCRLTLHRADERDWTTLGGEMQLLRVYLEIEQSRWGDLLDVEIDCQPALEDERLPHFLLLPLVENALKYGRATSPDRVGFRLSARREQDGALLLIVANTGEWLEPVGAKPVSSLGIGLHNLRERLARHYPRSHALEISSAGGWVTVSLRLVRRSG